jgi:hypothetical protein
VVDSLILHYSDRRDTSLYLIIGFTAGAVVRLTRGESLRTLTIIGSVAMPLDTERKNSRGREVPNVR